MSTLCHCIVRDLLLTQKMNNLVNSRNLRSKKEFIMFNPIYPDCSSICDRSMFFLMNYLRCILQLV